MTRRNRRFLKKIISTLADKELVDISGGEVRDNCRRSARLVERYEKSNGGDVRKVEMNGFEFLGKGGDRR